MAKDFNQKTVVITGAGGMLGRVLSARFAAEGAELILLDMSRDALAAIEPPLRELARQVTSHVLDLTDEAAINALGARLCVDHPSIDVLCNNAGMHTGDTNLPVDQVDQASWLRIFAVNTVAPLLLAQALRPSLKVAGGAVVNQSSMASYAPMNPYGLTKLALNAMTHAMAHAFGGDGIRVNAVAPGRIDTELNRSTMPADVYRRIEGMQMLARTGTPEDIADLTLFLASARSRFITAEVISCDGGSGVRGWHS